MGDVQLSPLSRTPPPPPQQKNSVPMLYYGLVVVATVAIILAVYNLLIIKWCRRGEQDSPPNQFAEATTASSQSFQLSSVNLLDSFKYKKEITVGRGQVDDGAGAEQECAVCLSVFEEGEEVRQLPRCNHSFHAPCIDMWLYSHLDCPLCRTEVDSPPSDRRHSVAAGPQNSREGLLNNSS